MKPIRNVFIAVICVLTLLAAVAVYNYYTGDNIERHSLRVQREHFETFKRLDSLRKKVDSLQTLVKEISNDIKKRGR